jgi:tetratricopeptide (TPR) repeat protein
MGWLWFLGTLAPVNGVVQYGNMSRNGRCMYLPLIGLLIILVWGMSEVFQRLMVVRRQAAKNLGTCVAVSIVLVLMTVCWVEVGYWGNNKTFFERQIKLVPNNPYFNQNLAVTYNKLGRYEEASYYANRAITIWPKVYQGHDLLAKIYARQGNAELSSYHRNKASDIRADVRHEHRRWISQNTLAATVDAFLREQ